MFTCRGQATMASCLNYSTMAPGKPILFNGSLHVCWAYVGGHLVSLDVSWNGLEDGLAPLAAAIQKGGGAPLKSLNLAGTRPTDEVSAHLVAEIRSQQSHEA